MNGTELSAINTATRNERLFIGTLKHAARVLSETKYYERKCAGTAKSSRN